MTKLEAEWVIGRYSKDIKRSTQICRYFCTCAHCPRRVLGECSDVPVTAEQLLDCFNRQTVAERDWGNKQLKEYQQLIGRAGRTQQERGIQVDYTMEKVNDN